MVWTVLGLALLSIAAGFLSVSSAFLGILPFKGNDHFEQVPMFLAFAFISGLSGFALGWRFINKKPALPFQGVGIASLFTAGFMAATAGLGLSVYLLMLLLGEADQKDTRRERERLEKPLPEQKSKTLSMTTTELESRWKANRVEMENSLRDQTVEVKGMFYLSVYFDRDGAQHLILAPNNCEMRFYLSHSEIGNHSLEYDSNFPPAEARFRCVFGGSKSEEVVGGATELIPYFSSCERVRGGS